MTTNLLWRRKTTGEVVKAMQWIPGETSQELRDLIISNVPEDDPLAEEDVDGFILLTFAIIDAHPKDWIIVEPDSTKALIPKAFEEAYEPMEDV